MLQWDMSRPEGFQLPLLVEFGGLPAENPTLLAQPPFEGLTTPQEGLSRFVRSVNEEVVIRTANDAANHLMRHVYTPFNQFDQEELWTLLMNTKNRVTHEVLIYRGNAQHGAYSVGRDLQGSGARERSVVTAFSCSPLGRPDPKP